MSDFTGWLSYALTEDSEANYGTLPVAGWSLAVAALLSFGTAVAFPAYTLTVALGGGWALVNWLLLSLLIKSLMSADESEPQENAGENCEKTHKHPPMAFTFAAVIAKLMWLLILVLFFASFGDRVLGVVAGLSAPLLALLLRAVANLKNN